jgi:glycosyltransferase involved in cell wall biosynthesis
LNAGEATLSFTDQIFAPYDPRGGSQIPLTQYQEFCFRRFKMDDAFDTNTDKGRFKALVWYLESYGAHRYPMPIPFSAEQVRWMMEGDSASPDEPALPRVIEAIQRRSLGHINPYEDRSQFLTVAYWWSIQMAPQFGAHHFLVPDAFIDVLSAPTSQTTDLLPVSNFLRGYIDRRPDEAWSTDHVLDRLTCYARLLRHPVGLYHALFFPVEVLEALVDLTRWAADEGVDLTLAPLDLEQIGDLSAGAQAYAARHREMRSGRHHISAPLLELDWVALMKAPAPASAAPAVKLSGTGSNFPAPVRVIGAINSVSGLGQAARMSIHALRSVGVQPEAMDFYLDNPAPRQLFFQDAPLKPTSGAINLIHLSGESAPLAAAYLQPELFKGAYNIGFFFWELPRAAMCHDLALDLLDEIWVASDFNLQTYRALTDKPVIKVGMAVEDLPAVLQNRAATRAAYDLPEDATVFMTSFDSYSFISRKNPAGAIRSFLKAFPDPEANVRLIIKTHNLSAVLGDPNTRRLMDEVKALIDSDPRLVLIDQTLPYADLLTLKAACDCYISLHRSEGWGFGVLEAMQLGLPVIATAFSGNLEFCNSGTAYCVPYGRTYLKPDDYIFVRPGDVWADPDEAVAAQMMRKIAKAPAAGRTKGVAAKAFVGAHFSPAGVGLRYRARLDEIRACFR